MGQLMQQNSFRKQATPINTVKLLGKTTELSVNFAASIAKSLLKKVIKRGINQGIGF